MAKIFNESYYVDLDSIVDVCNMNLNTKDEDGNDVLELNVFKYELIKMMLERVINDYDDSEEDDDIFSKDMSASKSFNLAFNTLVQYEIIKEIK
jgi:hypothetical protein